MARTVIGVNHPAAVKKQSAFLAYEFTKKSYWGRSMEGVGEGTQQPIMVLTDLEKQSGDQIDYQLSMALTMAPIEGRDMLSGNEEPLEFYSGKVMINQMRQGVDLGGRIDRKRTLHKLREVSRAQAGDWWGRAKDEIVFCYLSGARGVNAGFLLPLSWAGRAGNPLRAPDAEHHRFAGAATSVATLTVDDIMTLRLIDVVKTHAETMGGGIQRIPRISPIMIEGDKHFVMLMDPWSEFDLRNNTTTGQWLDIQKAAAGSIGSKSPIFRGGMGMYNNVVLHSHESVIRFADGGAGGDVPYVRNLFLGRQAGVVAYGDAGKDGRFKWTEEMEDHDDKVRIGTHCMWGFKKGRYVPSMEGLDDTNGLDFGVIAVDTASDVRSAAIPAP